MKEVSYYRMIEVGYYQIFLMWFDIIIINLCFAFFVKYSLDGFVNNAFVLILLAPILFLLFKYFKRRSVTLNVLLVGLITVVLASVLMKMIFKSKYNNDVIVKTNYVGVVSRETDETDSFGRNDEYEGYISPLIYHKLYVKDSNINELIDSLKETNDMVGTEKFIFLETGLVKGYKVDRILNDSYVNLFFKVIPFFILETFLNSLLIFILSLFFMLILHVYYVRNKRGMKKLLIPITFEEYDNYKVIFTKK
ncbi:hypothetical protein [Empedobacter sp. R132-2]|uniref:hypothetical protein n=1 Tax=Empedobacter sp. R132-2 TaxID=2746740 RepID=UPI0025791E38|nr:hypothetical protein [Empedobacter sp. R132-2]MDM1138007.1 hypothetical protein [Empedobacter sp. R132-2]